MIPFTQAEFLAVFRDYNLAFWPVQTFLLGLGLAAVLFAATGFKRSDQLVSSILSFLWIWMGVAYHFFYFTTINKAAYLFGALFVVEGISFFVLGVTFQKIHFKYPGGWRGAAGVLFLVYSLLIYPVLGRLLGHVYPDSPTFGLPCPTTIFTFGLLFWGAGRNLRIILIIPLIWALVGSSAAFSLGIREDLGLLAAGLGGLFLFLKSGETRR